MVDLARSQKTPPVAVGPDVIGVDLQQPDAALAELAGTVDIDDIHRLTTGKVTLEIAEHGTSPNIRS